MTLSLVRPWRRLLSIVCLAGLAAAGSALLFTPAAKADKAPEPSPYPVAPELDFKLLSGPKRIVVSIPGEPNGQAFYYITYTVTNKGDKPYNFLPTFDMLSDDGRLIRSDRAIPPGVFEAIKKREGNKLLETAKQIEGPIQVGEDQARDGVAIWPEPMSRMEHFSIFAADLSEEYAVFKPEGGDLKPTKPGELIGKSDEEKAKYITLRKTLQLDFHIAGDEIRPGEDEVHAKGKKWVMR
jgi:hypothetical protein